MTARQSFLATAPLTGRPAQPDCLGVEMGLAIKTMSPADDPRCNPQNGKSQSFNQTINLPTNQSINQKCKVGKIHDVVTLNRWVGEFCFISNCLGHWDALDRLRVSVLVAVPEADRVQVREGDAVPVHVAEGVTEQDREGVADEVRVAEAESLGEPVWVAEAEVVGERVVPWGVLSRTARWPEHLGQADPLPRGAGTCGHFLLANSSYFQLLL